MKLNDIENIVKMMRDYSLTEFKIEMEDCKLSMSRAVEGAVPAASPAVVITQSTPAAASAPAPAPEASVPSAPVEEQTIESPLVGTFYRAASPEARAFIEVGDHVEPGTVVGIIEAMKVMNEIKAEKRGVIKEIRVDNGSPVEYGQVLFVLE